MHHKLSASRSYAAAAVQVVAAAQQHAPPKEMHPVIAATVSCLLNDNGRVVWSPAADQLNGSKSGQWVTVTDACFISAANRPSKPLMNVGRQAGLHMVDVPRQILQVIDQNVSFVMTR